MTEFLIGTAPRMTARKETIANKLSSSESASLLQKGFDGYISDPADVDEIIKKIEQTTAIIY